MTSTLEQVLLEELVPKDTNCVVYHEHPLPKRDAELKENITKWLMSFGITPYYEHPDDIDFTPFYDGKQWEFQHNQTIKEVVGDSFNSDVYDYIEWSGEHHRIYNNNYWSKQFDEECKITVYRPKLDDFADCWRIEMIMNKEERVIAWTLISD